MWISADGRVATVAVPPANTPNIQKLDSGILALSESEVEELESLLDDIMWEASELVKETSTPDGELEFFEEVPPLSLLEGLDWARLLGSSARNEFELILPRWRLDIAEVVQQRIADLT